MMTGTFYLVETLNSGAVLCLVPTCTHSLSLPKVLLKSVLSTLRGLEVTGEGQQRQVHHSFALYSSANPTYVDHRGPCWRHWWRNFPNQ